MRANLLTIDFETYFDSKYSLRRMSIPEYVHDPRFHVLGLAVRFPDGRTEFRADVDACLQGLQETFGRDLEHAAVVIHNGHFDLYVLSKLYDIHPPRFIDTLCLSHAVYGRRGEGGASGSLKSVAERLGLESKGDLTFMQGIRSPDPMQFAALSDYARHDVELTYQACVRLLPMISNPAVELPIMQHTVRLFTERGLCVDRDGLQDLIARQEASVAATLKALGLRREDVTSDKLFAEHLGAALQATGRSVPTKWSEKQRKRIPAIAKTDREMRALLQDPDERVRLLAEIRLGQKSSDSTVARLYKLQRIADAADGTLPVHLVYHGAHTGRFSGGGGFNLQNLPRSGVGGEIRGLLRPKPGHSFVIADYAQIEPRVLAVLSGQTELVAAFEEGRDVYCEFATGAFGREVRKPLPKDSPEVRAQLGALRHVGKRAVLGLGYGMGALRFLAELQSDPDVSHLFSLGALSPSIVWKIVRQYREQYSMISGYWSWFDSEIRSEAQNVAERDGLSLEPGGAGVTLEIPLPSGRVMGYRRVGFTDDPREFRCLDEAGNEYVCQSNKSVLTYGGDRDLHGRILTENFVQAIARDILVEAILALEAEGLPVVLHIHDEVVVEVPENEAGDALRRVQEIMCRPPKSLEGCPLAVEARIADRFGK